MAALENLQLQQAHVLDLPLQLDSLQDDADDDPVVAFCLDSTEPGTLYAATQRGTVHCLQQHGKKLLWSVPLPLDPALEEEAQQRSSSAATPTIAAFAHVVELDAVFIAAASGQMLLLDTASQGVEEVGVVTGGVAAAAWSPSGEQLALLGYNGLLLVMNKEWDVLTEVAVPPPEQQQQQDGEQQLPQLLSATLSWRGDSCYLATNTLWSSSSSSRVLHIWDREAGQLHATGQSAAGLSAAIAWQPNCRHLFAAAALPPAKAATPGAAAAAAGDQQQQQLKAAPHQRVVSAAPKAPSGTSAAAAASGSGSQQQQPDGSWQQHIILYEHNGLQHGGFDVPTDATAAASATDSSSSSMVIDSLHWSSDSRLLAVILAPAAADGGAGGVVSHEWRLQLWCRSNWHWHLKHEACHELPAASGRLMAAWDDALPARLHLMSGVGHYSRLDFGVCVNISGRGTAAVIDGHQVLLTPLRHGLVPPPMCAVRALLPRPAVALAWCDGDIRGDLGGGGADEDAAGNCLVTNGHAAVSDDDDDAFAVSDSPTAADAAAAAAAAAGASLQQQHQPQPQQQGSAAEVDVAAAGFCETLAVLLSNGSLVFFRAVESDLWEETLEDQVALGGPKEYLLPLGFFSAAAAAAGNGITSSSSSSKGSNGASAAAVLANDAEYFGGLSIPSGPWSNTYGSAVTAVTTQGGDVQRVQLPPLSAAAGAAGVTPSIPLAEGRTVLGMVWLGLQQLLLLAAPLEEGLEDGEGTVLVEVSVTLPPSLSSSSLAETTQQQQVQTAAVATSYAGGRVLTAAAHPAGDAVLQLTSGQLLHYSSSSSSSGAVNGSAGRQQQPQQLVPLPAGACFPVGCPTLLVLPLAPSPTAAVGSNGLSSGSSALQRAAAVAAAAPAVGLSPSGVLYWGSKVVAGDVTSAAVRGGGPGGPALLYVTRQSLLYVVMVAQLPTYTHALPDESRGQLTWRASEYPGELKAAISVAMRPTAAAAAAIDPHMRAVEQGAAVLCVPYAGVSAVLVMPRGNLEGICPRLLVLAAITDALEGGRYAQAWDLAVTNRVDLNLLVDYAWPRFTAAADASDAAAAAADAADATAAAAAANAFVAAVPSASDLCDLLLALTPGSTLEDGGTYSCLAGMLGWQQRTQPARRAAAAAAGGAADAAAAAGSKVSRVCEAVRAAVLRLPGRFVPLGHLKTVVMSYARSEPPSLESALLAIREVKEAAVALTQQQQPTADAADADSDTGAAAAAAAPFTVTAADISSAAGPAAGSSSDAATAAAAAALSAAADAALKHLLLYVDVDQLFQAALGLYDLALAFMAVSHSQKDPGEYLSQLSGFGAVANRHLERHAIDMSLGRYSRALEHLVAAGPAHFEAALRLARDKGLLRQLLALTQQQQQAGDSSSSSNDSSNDSSSRPSAQQRLVAVLSAYGDLLLASRRPEDAAVAYSAAGLMEQALAAYRAAGAWRMAMVLSARLGHSAQQQQELARDLAEQLLGSGSGADAAALLLQYLGDADGAVAALITAKEWREALRVAYAQGRADLVDTDVVPAAAQAASVLLSDANEAIERLAKYSNRLSEVRRRRQAMAAAVAAAEADAGAADAVEDDLVSELPSMISGFSIYTDRTSAGATGVSNSSSAASSRAVSTVGGRKALRSEKKAAKKGQNSSKKIRAGTPGEEAALEGHLLGLGPARHVLEEAGQLAELLVMLEHTGDATKLQQRVGQWQAAAAEAAALVAEGRQQQQPQQQQQQQQQQQPSGTAAAAAAAATAEVRWKWDVLRDHK